jgi:hypothetical protein
MKYSALIAVITLSLGIAAPLVGHSQPAEPGGVPTPNSVPSNPAPSNPVPSNYGIDNPILQRAMNLARQTAEKANGGLNQYRAESAMYGPASQSPFVDNGNNTWTFTFLGGVPGFTTPTLESVITVAKDASRITIDYNGPIRQPVQTSPSSAIPSVPKVSTVPATPPSLSLRRSMNLARQAAEKANGGLSQYRAESSMYGSTDQAPYLDNSNGSWTFNFKGGPPGFAIATVESVVTVSTRGEVTLNYNGPIRPQPSPNINPELNPELNPKQSQP